MKTSNLLEKLISKSVNIKENEWILKDVTIIKFENGVVNEEKLNHIK